MLLGNHLPPSSQRKVWLLDANTPRLLSLSLFQSPFCGSLSPAFTYKQNHIVFTLLWLTYYCAHDILTVHLCGACISILTYYCVHEILTVHLYVVYISISSLERRSLFGFLTYALYLICLIDVLDICIVSTFWLL